MAGVFLFQVVLDCQASQVDPELLVRLWGQMFLDLLETPASLAWMESMVNMFPLVLCLLFVSYFLSFHFPASLLLSF